MPHAYLAVNSACVDFLGHQIRTTRLAHILVIFSVICEVWQHFQPDITTTASVNIQPVPSLLHTTHYLNYSLKTCGDALHAHALGS